MPPTARDNFGAFRGIIAPFQPRQLPRILQIEKASFPEDAYSAAMFRELYRDCGPLFLVARAGMRVTGYIATCLDGDTAEVISIAVDPAYRRHGIGAALLRRTLVLLRRFGAARLDLMVREGNRTAIAFYRRLGFARVKRVRGYYSGGGHALQMTKTLRR